MTPPQLEGWLTDLNSPDPVERLKSLARLCRIGHKMAKLGGEKLGTYSSRVFESVNDLFVDLEPYEKAWVLFFLTRSANWREHFDGVYRAARRSDVPMVRIAYLLTEVKDPQSPQLDAALRHDHPMIKQFAEAQRTAVFLVRQAATADSPQASGRQ